MIADEISWAEHPNAKYIDRIIVALTEYPEEMSQGWTHYITTNTKTGYGIVKIGWEAGWNKIEYNNRVILNHLRDIYVDAIDNNGANSAEYAFMALCAWDTCGYLLDTTDYTELILLGKLGNHAASLLSMVCYSFNLIKHKYNDDLERLS